MHNQLQKFKSTRNEYKETEFKDTNSIEYLLCIINKYFTTSGSVLFIEV